MPDNTVRNVIALLKGVPHATLLVVCPTCHVDVGEGCVQAGHQGAFWLDAQAGWSHQERFDVVGLRYDGNHEVQV